MIISAAGHHHMIVVWLVLQFASAGVFHHAGIKVPFFTFFGHDSGLRPKEAPVNMLIAMGIAAFLCVGIGVYPDPLYSILPYPEATYVPYTGAHVVGQLQLLMFGALAFCLLILSGHYPAEIRAINLDTDWFYRKGATVFYRTVDKGFNTLNRICDKNIAKRLAAAVSRTATRLPAQAAYAAVIIAQRLGGKNKSGKKYDPQHVFSAFESGAVPLGISAALAAIFLVLIFMFT
jgi:multicomponent Na+:H+ antiporter subunit D